MADDNQFLLDDPTNQYLPPPGEDGGGGVVVPTAAVHHGQEAGAPALPPLQPDQLQQLAPAPPAAAVDPNAVGGGDHRPEYHHQHHQHVNDAAIAGAHHPDPHIHQAAQTGAVAVSTFDPAASADDAATATLSRRQKAARGTLAKIDSVYLSVHALSRLSSLLSDARTYLEMMSSDLVAQGAVLKESFDIPCDCLQLAVDGLEQHSSIIGQAIVNSSETPEVKYAQRKLIQRRENEMSGRRLNHSRGVMERDPRSVLRSSLEYAREVLDDICERTDPDFMTEKARAKKRKMLQSLQGDDIEAARGSAKKKSKTSSDKENDGEKEGGDDKRRVDEVEVIDLPQPMNGRQYSPLETVAYLVHLTEHVPRNKPYLRLYKEKMIKAKLVPIQKGQLNTLLKQHGGPDKPVAPLEWNERRTKEMGWERLLTQFQARQNAGAAWSIEDTLDVLTKVAAEMERSGPTKKVVEGHHATLIKLHNHQNHINEQLQIQERQLQTNPPPAKLDGKLDRSKLQRITYDKNDKKYKNIELPPPSEGNLIYTPAETVMHINNFANGEPKPSRRTVRAFKEKLIAEKYIPISISQLNHMVKVHSASDAPSIPKTWNAKGAEDIINIDDLARHVRDSHVMWVIENTRDVVWAAKRAKARGDPNEVKMPDKKTINAYHAALLAMPDIAQKVIKPKVVKLKPGPKAKSYSQL